MAWIKIRVSDYRDCLLIPETVYENMFKNCKDIVVVEDSKPISEVVEETKLEEVIDNGLSESGLNEVRHNRKSTKKVVD